MNREMLWCLPTSLSIIAERPHPQDEHATEHYWKPYLVVAESVISGGPIPFKTLRQNGLKMFLREGMEPGNVLDAVSIAAERCSKKQYAVPEIPIVSDYDLQFLMAELEKVVAIRRIRRYK